MTGNVSLRSTARPPDSAMLTVICASSGRVLAGSLSSLTGNVALPDASVARQVVEFLTDRRDLVVEQSEGIAGEAGTLLCSADRYLA